MNKFSIMVFKDRYEITNLALQVLPGGSDLVSVGMKEYRQLLKHPTLKAAYIDTMGRDWTNVFYRLKGAVEQIDVAKAQDAIVQVGCQGADDITLLGINAILDIVRGQNDNLNIMWGTQSGVHLPPDNIYVFVVCGYSAQ